MLDDVQHNTFSVPVWGFVLNSEKYHSIDYVNHILNLSENEPTQKKSNFGGWQSRDDIHLDGIFQEFNPIILKLAKQILSKYTTSEPYMQSMWANINNKYDCNMTHFHEGELSGVFYLKVPQDSGRLVLINPAVRSTLARIRSADYPIQPMELACIFFPSWVEHYVERNLSDEARISISFNIGVR